MCNFWARRLERIVSHNFKSAENGMRFYTSGSNAVVDVRDVVSAMTFLMNSEIHSERFLITGENISFRELQTLIAKKLNKESQLFL